LWTPGRKTLSPSLDLVGNICRGASAARAADALSRAIDFSRDQLGAIDLVR
jgi:hypothetical protein